MIYIQLESHVNGRPNSKRPKSIYTLEYLNAEGHTPTSTFPFSYYTLVVPWYHTLFGVVFKISECHYNTAHSMEKILKWCPFEFIGRLYIVLHPQNI